MWFCFVFDQIWSLCFLIFQLKCIIWIWTSINNRWYEDKQNSKKKKQLLSQSYSNRKPLKIKKKKLFTRYLFSCYSHVVTLIINSLIFRTHFLHGAEFSFCFTLSEKVLEPLNGSVNSSNHNINQFNHSKENVRQRNNKINE